MRVTAVPRSVVNLLLTGAMMAVSGCADEPVPAPSPSAVPSAAPTAGRSAAPGGSQCTQTAADRLGWGAPTMQSDFDGTALPPDWHAYGPEPGHQREGLRTPDAITVADGALTIHGTQDGTTAAVSWHPGQKYGRWEACVRSERGQGGYHPVLLLWPVAEDWPVGGEIDWMEIFADDREETGFFLHYGANNDQEAGFVRNDATQWSAYALEWTPQKITAYLNGREWFSTTETDHFPPAPMNMTIQLDYFPPAYGDTSMSLDWAKQWALPESEPAQISLAPGDPATGQPDLYPERKPRPLG